MNKEEQPYETPPADPQSAPGLMYYITRLNPLQFHKRGRKAKALIALAAVCFFWGTTWIASKQAVMRMPALQMAGMRQALGGLCYVSFFVIKGIRWPRGREWRSILILSFLNFVLSNALSTWGVQYIDAGLGSIIGAIFPLWLVVIGLVAARVTPRPMALAGLVLGFAGICVIFYEHLNQSAGPGFIKGILLSIASTWSWAFGTIYTKKHAARFNPYFSLGLQMLISGIALTIGTSVAGVSIPWGAISWEAWAAIAYLVLFGSVIAFIAYLYALQNLPTEQVSIYAYINPVVAVLLGAIIFGESLTVFIVAGTAITLYGVYLVNKSAKR